MLIEPEAYLNSLHQQLEVMPPEKQLAFGAFCCESHLPDYLGFSMEEHWGNPDLFREAIDISWAAIAGEHEEDAKLQALLAKCVDATPDADDFETVLVDFAQDAAIMICHLIKFMESKDPQSIVSAASRARDLVDAKIQFTHQLDPTDPALESKIANDPMMQTELSRQDAALQEILQAGSSSDLAQLRTQWFRSS